MSADRDKCATCRAMADGDFVRQTPEHAIELAHIAGMAIGVALIAGTPTAKDARELAKQWLCEEHAGDLFFAAKCLAGAARKEQTRRKGN